MIRSTSLDDLLAAAGDAVQEGVLSIGNFDGVHLGHRALLARMRELADADGRPTVIVTFFPPAKVLFGDATYLTDADEKAELLAEFAPTAVVTVPFTHAFAKTDKDAFAGQVARLRPASIVVGEDFRFGRNRSGGLDDLREATARLDVFGLETHGGAPVKSSQIREHLAAGEIGEANTLLARPYRATGTVVRGQQRGASIGWPTANVDVPERKALPKGVFAVRVRHEDHIYEGMANSGPRPSFPEAPPALEVHLFEFDGDLYGSTTRVFFHAFLRGQRRFGGLEELKAQLARDAAAATDALRGVSGG